MFDDIIKCEMSEIHMNKLKLEFCGFLSDPTYSELTLADLTNDTKKQLHLCCAAQDGKQLLLMFILVSLLILAT